MKELKNLIAEAIGWNRADIDGFDDITPTMEMLEARNEVLERIQKLINELPN